MSDASVDPSVFLDNSEQVTSVFFATIHYRITQYRMGIMTLGFCRYQSSQVGSRQGFGLFMMSMQINLRQTSVSQSVGMDHTLENICFSPSERIWTTGLQRMPDFLIILKLNPIFWHWLMKGKVMKAEEFYWIFKKKSSECNNDLIPRQSYQLLCLFWHISFQYMLYKITAVTVFNNCWWKWRKKFIFIEISDDMR